MLDVKKVRAIVEEFVSGTDLFPVEVAVSPANEVEVVIDSDTAVSIDRCVELSRKIEGAFDRETEDFQLTVTSAGIGQPLKLLRQYRKALGKTVEVVLKNGEKAIGTLSEATEEAIRVTCSEKQEVEGKKRKQTVEVEREFPLSEVKTTRQRIEFR